MLKVRVRNDFEKKKSQISFSFHFSFFTGKNVGGNISEISSPVSIDDKNGGSSCEENIQAADDDEILEEKTQISVCSNDYGKNKRVDIQNSVLRKRKQAVGGPNFNFGRNCQVTVHYYHK